MEIKDLSGLGSYAPIIHELYKDMAQPAARNVGLALGAITSVGLFLHLLTSWGTDRLNICLKNNLEKYADRMKAVPLENVTEAPPEIAIPIIEKLSYVTNEDLRNLYIELLAKASINDLNRTAHPSFVNIINSLSPDEAIILRDLHNTKKKSIPCIEVRLLDSNKNSSSRKTPYYTKYDNDHELTYSENASAYISNLIGLGILQSSDMVLKKIKDYNKLEKILNKEYDLAKNKLNDEELDYSSKYRKLILTKMQVFITPFGELFLEAILSSKIDINDSVN